MEARERQGRSTPSPEQTTTRLVGELKRILRHSEDAETAIDVYKTADWIIGLLEEVKEEALSLAQADVEERGLEDLEAPAGSAGWREPNRPRLNEEAWVEAMGKDPGLRKIQQDYEAARSALERAQRPYGELPEPRFTIR